MPTSEQVLGGLVRMAATWGSVSIVWHVLLGSLAVALALGFRPSWRTMGILLGLPLWSVAIFSGVGGNPFNAVVFALVSIALFAISLRLPQDQIRAGHLWTTILGAACFAFGWLYPQFTQTPSLWPHLYASPIGLIPCPTLAATIGLAIVLGGLRSRSWALILGITGLVFGLSGALWLRVQIDWILFMGAAILLVTVVVFGPGTGASTAMGGPQTRA